MRKTSCRQEYVRWKSAHESGGRDGLVVERGITFFILRGLGDFPGGKSFWGVWGTSQGENHSEKSRGLPRGKLIPRGLRAFPRGKSFWEVWGTSQEGTHSERSQRLSKGKIILRGLGDFPSGGGGASSWGVWGTSQGGIIIYQKCEVCDDPVLLHWTGCGKLTSSCWS